MSDNGDQLDRDNRQPRDPDNDPPYSRVFVVCGKGSTEEELEAEFKPYGHLQYPIFMITTTTWSIKRSSHIKIINLIMYLNIARL